MLGFPLVDKHVGFVVVDLNMISGLKLVKQ
jgi:hypothetical protein